MRTMQHFNIYIHICIYICFSGFHTYVYVCMCVCVCVSGFLASEHFSYILELKAKV